MTDSQREKILTMLKETDIPFKHISDATGLSASTLKNYVEDKTKPTKANLTILDLYFSQISEKNSKNQITGNNNIIGDNSQIDMRSYNSDSPDVLRAQIDLLDERIKEKDAQIKEKDAQISRLLGILEGYNNK